MTTESTLVLIKPDAMRRGLAPIIIDIFNSEALSPVLTKSIRPARALLEQHYAFDQDWRDKVGRSNIAICQENGLDPMEKLETLDPVSAGEVVRQRLIDHIASGEVMAMIVKGDDAVARVRKLCGPTVPQPDDKQTLRGRFNQDTPIKALIEKRGLYNIVHSSGNAAEAKQELQLWFPDYQPILSNS